MIKTLDGVKKKRYDRVWEIGVDADGNCKPVIAVVHGKEECKVASTQCWADKQLCQDECDQINKQLKQTA